MFGFLKKGLKKVAAQFSKAAEEEKESAAEEKKEVPAAEQEKAVVEDAKAAASAEKNISAEEKAAAGEKQKQAAAGERKQAIALAERKAIAAEEKKTSAAEEKGKTTAAEKPAVAIQEQKAPEKTKGFFGSIAKRFSTAKISGEKFDELFWQLEMMLLENNVAVEVIEKLKADLKEAVVEKPLPRGRIEELVVRTLRESIENTLSAPRVELLARVKEKKPFIIAFVGVNGSGKTTTIAKLGAMLQKSGMQCVVAAADTFRAAAIQQLQEHADKLHIKLIKHDYGSDPAAVAFDAIKYAEAKGADVVLIDTAGRLHSNVNLMDEMRKIIRVAKPDMKIFVGESITGNDCVEQAKLFNEAVGVDGIILAKADVDEKGGAAISVSYVTKKPILYLGTGQEYDDLQPFSREAVLQSLGLSAA